MMYHNHYHTSSQSLRARIKSWSSRSTVSNTFKDVSYLFSAFRPALAHPLPRILRLDPTRPFHTMFRRFPPSDSGPRRGRRGGRDDSPDRLETIFDEHDRLFEEDLRMNNNRISSDFFCDDSLLACDSLGWPPGAGPDPRGLSGRGRDSTPPLFGSSGLGDSLFDDSPLPKRRGGGSLFDDSFSPERRDGGSLCDDSPSPRRRGGSSLFDDSPPPRRSKRGGGGSLLDNSPPRRRPQSGGRRSIFDESPPPSRRERGGRVPNMLWPPDEDDEKWDLPGIQWEISRKDPLGRANMGIEVRAKRRPAFDLTPPRRRLGQGLCVGRPGSSDVRSLGRGAPRSGGGRDGGWRSPGTLGGLGRGGDGAARRGPCDDSDDEESEPRLPFIIGRAPPRPGAWD